MAKEFIYTVRMQGQLARNTTTGDTVSAVRARLLSLGIEPLTIVESRENDAHEQRTLWNHPFYYLPARSVHIELSLVQLALMLKNGIHLLEALDLVAEQAGRSELSQSWLAISEKIQRGESLYDAMRGHRCFNPLVLQLVRVGEQTGTLELALQRAAEQLESRRTHWKSLLTALAYPTIVAVASISVCIYMIVGVIPQLQKYLSVMGRKLPRMTQSLIDVSQFLQTHGLAIAFIVALLIVTVIAIYRWPTGRLFIDQWLLRVPILGALFRMSGTITIAGSLALMIRSGMTLVDSLKTAQELHNNRYLALRAALARQRVVSGASLSGAFKQSTAYMPMLASMVAIAEKAGQLDDALDEVATFYSRQLQSTIKTLSAWVEPAIILIVGSLVGYIYMAFFLALFSAGGNLR